MGDLAAIALLDGNGSAIRGGEVDRGERRRHVERDAVLAREHGDGVGADLVGDVAVGRNAVGADDDEVDEPLAHQRSGHVVGDDGRRNAVAHEFPRGEAGALEERPRLVGQHLDLLALLVRGADDPEGRAVAGGGERAGVAVGEDARAAGHDLGAEGSHRPAARHVLVVNRARLDFEPRGEVGHRAAGLGGLGEDPLHAVDGPEQVDGGGSRRGQLVACLLELDGERARALRRRPARAEREPHRGRDADGRSATNDHGLDGPGHVVDGRTAHVDLPRRELALVDHHDLAILPRNRRKHRRAIIPQRAGRASGGRRAAQRPGPGVSRKRPSKGCGSRSLIRCRASSPRRFASTTSRS